MSSFNDAILILKPASYKAGTLYSVKPNAAAGDFTVARASTSTRVNSDLKLEEMAINVPLLSYEGGCPHLETHAAYTQLLTYSNDFGNSSWTLLGATLTSGHSSPSVDYPTDAYKLVESSVDEVHYVAAQSITSSGTDYTCSVYAKKGENNFLQFFHSQGGGHIDFDLNTGSVGSVGSTFSDGVITELLNGWYRCSAKLASSVTGSTTVYITLVSSSTATRAASYTGDGTSGLYIFGANLTETTYAHPYAYTNGATATVTDTNEQVALPTGVTTVTLTDYLGVETVDSSPADPYIIPVGKWSKIIMT